jgi:RNA binding exosome subunit
MNEDWVIVYSTHDFFKAEIIKNMLISNNIEAVNINQKDSSYHFGLINIFTLKLKSEKAMELINNEF